MRGAEGFVGSLGDCEEIVISKVITFVSQVSCLYVDLSFELTCGIILSEEGQRSRNLQAGSPAERCSWWDAMMKNDVKLEEPRARERWIVGAFAQESSGWKKW